MSKVTTILFAAVAVVAATLAKARADTGVDTVQDLYNQCTRNEPFSHMLCIARLEGAAEILSMISDHVDKSIGICPRNGYTFGQLRRAYINWAKKNPRSWTESASFGIWAALREQWPCK